MALESIPIVALSAMSEAQLTGNARPLLMEIASRLQNLLERGEAHTLDLGALPLNDADKSWLKAQLGKGEIRAELQANDRSSIDETGCPGVWWVTHRGEQDQVQSEFIEICRVPELLMAHPDDIETGYESLKIRVSELS